MSDGSDRDIGDAALRYCKSPCGSPRDKCAPAYRFDPKKERDITHAQLLDGSLHILIGTHAVIEDNVQFRNLGFVVIDEQHRFGVAQRARLWKKNSVPPHVLVMTATPIPRTLAMTVYGDLSVSVIDELPPDVNR